MGFGSVTVTPQIFWSSIDSRTPQAVAMLEYS
jgi:hypothetical protein